jgi:CheY-like chemotaxis protein
MVLRPAWGVHTAFMRFPIDVVFLDADQVVIKIAANLQPWRTASCRGAREVVELAAGECARRGLETGDRVAWASRTAAELRADKSAPLLDDNPEEPRARVLVASADARFVKLARFLLSSRDLEVDELASLDRLPDLMGETDVDVVVLDGGNKVADALRVANAARARRPELPIVIAAETGGRAPAGVRVFDRWNETEELLLDIERLLAEQLTAPIPIGGGSEVGSG